MPFELELIGIFKIRTLRDIGEKENWMIISLFICMYGVKGIVEHSVM